MNRELLKNISFYTIILALQLLIFNQFKLFGFVTPSIYLIIFIHYKISYDKTFLLLLGFLTGFIVDLSMQTYGCHTFSTITICYLRSRIEKSSFGINANLPLAMIKGTPLYSRVSFFLSLIAVHSIIYYSFIFFNITLLSTIFLYAFINSIATFIIVWIISRLISNR
jgi:rod shape-determining protein MreD